MSSVFAWGIGLWVVVSVVALALPRRSSMRFMPGSALGAWLGFSSFDSALLLMKWSDYHHYGLLASRYMTVTALALMIFGLYGFAGVLLSYRQEATTEAVQLQEVQEDVNPDDWDITWTGIGSAPEFARH